jgi:phage terminase large subunit
MSGSNLKLRTAPVFEPLLQPARYKGAWGGRGSGKSHFFAGLMVEEHYAQPGQLSVCIREIQKSLKESAKRTIEQQLRLHNLGEADGFRAYTDRIATPGDGLIIFVGMQNHTAESLKSLEGYNRAWVEQAETLSQKSFDILRRPTASSTVRSAHASATAWASCACASRRRCCRSWAPVWVRSVGVFRTGDLPFLLP